MFSRFLVKFRVSGSFRIVGRYVEKLMLMNGCAEFQVGLLKLKFCYIEGQPWPLFTIFPRISAVSTLKFCPLSVVQK